MATIEKMTLIAFLMGKRLAVRYSVLKPGITNIPAAGNYVKISPYTRNEDERNSTVWFKDGYEASGTKHNLLALSLMENEAENCRLNWLF